MSNTRGGIGKKSMIHNDAIPVLEVDPETYEVRADGVLLWRGRPGGFDQALAREAAGGFDRAQLALADNHPGLKVTLTFPL